MSRHLCFYHFLTPPSKPKRHQINQLNEATRYNLTKSRKLSTDALELPYTLAEDEPPAPEDPRATHIKDVAIVMFLSAWLHATVKFVWCGPARASWVGGHSVCWLLS